MSDWRQPRGVPRIALLEEALARQKPRNGTHKPRGATKPTRGKAHPPEVFLAALKVRGLPQPHREYKFHDSRLWRFDYAFPAWLLAIENDGGLWVRGAHNRGARILKTHEKENCAASQGWRILHTTPQLLCSEEFLTVLHSALNWHSP